jgi:hypothetical protein
MSCERYQQTIVGRLYEENTPQEDAALDAHLTGCSACASDLASLARVRGAIRDNEPELPRVPRVVVLGTRPRFQPALLAASLLGAALLAGGAAGGGYALLKRPAPAPATASAPMPALDPASEALIAKEVDRRVALLAARHEAPAGPGAPVETSGGAVTKAELEAALGRLERKVNGARAADLDYMMSQVTASEVRSGQRIGQTNQALRYVALASNPRVSEQ